MARGAGPKKIERLLDLRGKRAPFTIVAIARQAKALGARESLRVLIDDKRTVEEARDWAERMSSISIQTERLEDHWAILIETL